MTEASKFTPAEATLLRSFLARTTGFLAWGCGSNTEVAASLVSGWLISLDSSLDRVKRTRDVCMAVPRVPMAIEHVDIGPVGALGYPENRARIDHWPDYHSAIWNVLPQAQDADLVLVDGRFRVACALQALLHCRPETPILLPDYDVRGYEHYCVIAGFARPVARADRLSVFVRRGDFDAIQARVALDVSRYDPR